MTLLIEFLVFISTRTKILIDNTPARVIIMNMENFPEQPTCINLNCERPVAYSHTKKSGAKRWRPVCSRCHLASYGAKPLDEGIVEVKKTYCENIDGRLNDYKCTTTIPYKGALELDHIDGNVLNNFPVNVQTLCKVCHSYKSHLNNDFKKNRARLQKEEDKMIDYE